MSLLFSLIERQFCMHFYVPFHFFKVPFDFSSLPKPAFCKAKVHRGTPKGAKMSFIFFFNRMAFFHVFLRLPFHFFQLPFDFPSLPQPAFCKAKLHRGTPKGGKMSVPFFLNQMAFFHVFLRAISFFQSLFQFCLRCKSSILQVLSTWGYP